MVRGRGGGQPVAVTLLGGYIDGLAHTISMGDPSVSDNCQPAQATPLASTVLEWLLGPLSVAGYRRPLVKRLAALVSGVLVADTARRGDLTTALAGLRLSPAKPESIARRLARFLDDPAADPQRLLPALVTPELLTTLLADEVRAHAANERTGAFHHQRFRPLHLIVDLTTKHDQVVILAAKAPVQVAERHGEAERAIVAPLVRWGQRVIWLLDRGCGNSPFLGGVLACVRFVARWRRDDQLCDATTGEVAKASQLSRRVRSRWTMQLHDPGTGQLGTVGASSLPVTPPETPRPLWLVVARRKDETGKKRNTLWVVTTEDASTEAGARCILRAYTRRWQVEWAFRFAQHELGVQSMRLEVWASREKLWRLAEVAQIFLLSLLVVLTPAELTAVLRWCHRTGHHARSATAPLSRLRDALANL